MSDNTYARVSSLAVISAVSGVATVFSLVLPPLAMASIVGVSTGYAALHAIRRYELGGINLARFGLIASTVFVPVGPFIQYVAYQLEAPSGYLRIDFAKAMKTDSPEPLDLYEGEKVCLKGYALYGSRVDGRFYLVPSLSGRFGDMASCVPVELPPGQTWDRSDSRLAVSGLLVRVKHPEQYTAKFKLTQAVVRWSLTGVGVRPGGGC